MDTGYGANNNNRLTKNILVIGFLCEESLALIGVIIAHNFFISFTPIDARLTRVKGYLAYMLLHAKGLSNNVASLSN